MITRQQAINLFGSAVLLAEALGYTSRHAIYMWPKDGNIPEGAYLKIRYQLKPEAFNANGTLKAQRDAAGRVLGYQVRLAPMGASPTKKRRA